VNVRTLRFKLGLTNGLFISIFFVVFGYIRYQTFTYRADRNFDRRLEQQADFFSENLRSTPEGFDWEPSATPADVMALDAIRPFFVLTDLEGRILREEYYGYYVQRMLDAQDLNEILHRPSGFTDAASSEGRRFRFISSTISFPSGQKVVLHLGRSLDELNDMKREYWLIWAYSVPLVLIISVGVGWFLAARALRPFGEVANIAEQITSQKLNTQIVNVRREQEIQRLVQSFNAMVARLSRSFEQMRTFNANVAHELRTPLAILQGETEVALRSSKMSEEIRSVLISNLEELGRLTRIVNDILTLSEVEAGSQILEKKPVNIRTLVADLSEQMQLLAMERNIRIEVEELPDAIVEADDLWIRRAILNLLDNAIKYSRDGGRIQVSMVRDETRVHVSIRDEGIGISEQDQPHIFDPMFRTDPARHRDSGGAGLGLALVKWVIEAHQGQIRVKSQTNQGAEFQLEFPLSRSPGFTPA